MTAELTSKIRPKLTYRKIHFLNFSVRLLRQTYPSSLLARLSGQQRFLIPFNVLDLVYGQTVSWMGVYYCPLLPLIGTVTLIATFYIKKVPSNMDNLLCLFI